MADMTAELEEVVVEPVEPEEVVDMADIIQLLDFAWLLIFD